MDTAITYEDADHNEIIAEEYDCIADTAFRDCDKMEAKFSWLSLNDLDSAADMGNVLKDRLLESYRGFAIHSD